MKILPPPPSPLPPAAPRAADGASDRYGGSVSPFALTLTTSDPAPASPPKDNPSADAPPPAPSHDQADASAPKANQSETNDSSAKDQAATNEDSSHDKPAERTAEKPAKQQTDKTTAKHEAGKSAAKPKGEDAAKVSKPMKNKQDSTEAEASLSLLSPKLAKPAKHTKGDTKADAKAGAKADAKAGAKADAKAGAKADAKAASKAKKPHHHDHGRATAAAKATPALAGKVPHAGATQTATTQTTASQIVAPGNPTAPATAATSTTPSVSTTDDPTKAVDKKIAAKIGAATKRSSSPVGTARAAAAQGSHVTPDPSAKTADGHHAQPSAPPAQDAGNYDSGAKPSKSVHADAAQKPFVNSIATAHHHAGAAQPAPTATPSTHATSTAAGAHTTHDGLAAHVGSSDSTGMPGAVGANPTPAHGRTAAVAYTARPIPVPAPVHQVALHIRRAAEDGIDRFTVQLKPADLGKISAQIEIHDHHHVHVVLSAQRQDTLDALQRDSRFLQRALQDAGLHTDAGSLSFQFQGQGQGQSAFSGNNGPAMRASSIALPAAVSGGDGIIAAAHAAAVLRPGGIDLRV